MRIAIESLERERNQHLGQLEELREESLRFTADVNEARIRMQKAEERREAHLSRIEGHEEAVRELNDALQKLLPSTHPTTEEAE